MTVAAAAFMVISCENAYKKAEKAAMAEKARQDSIAAAQKAAKEKTAMEIIKFLPEEPEFEIETNLGSITVKLYSKTPKHRTISPNLPFQASMTTSCSTVSSMDS